MKNKRGDNLMVSYVLLIVIAVALSVAVYAFLKLRLPSDKPECPADISLSIEEASCSRAGQIVTLRLFNRGLFNVSGAFIRFGEANKSVRSQVNTGREFLFPEGNSNSAGLPPGTSTGILTNTIEDLSAFSSDQEFVIEVQPAIFANRALVPCTKKIIYQEIKCS